MRPWRSIMRVTSNTCSHLQHFSHALTAAFVVTVFGTTPQCCISTRSHMATRHFLPFSHAVTPALHVTTLGLRLQRRTWQATRNASRHCEHLSHALIAAPHMATVGSLRRNATASTHRLPRSHAPAAAPPVTASSKTPRRRACSKRANPWSHRAPLPAALIAELCVMPFGSSAQHNCLRKSTIAFVYSRGCSAGPPGNCNIRRQRRAGHCSPRKF
mmetsp:Transcript_55924/g.155953  ORF Transcript_55924/g.155953 Transcript_55924/m.155953 type:complete len:215 (-) Transcript_55924:87-731(-)